MGRCPQVDSSPGPFQPPPDSSPDPPLLPARRAASAPLCAPGKRGAPRGAGRLGGVQPGLGFWGTECSDVTSPSCRCRGEGQRRFLPRKDMPRGRMRRDKAAVPRCQSVVAPMQDKRKQCQVLRLLRCVAALWFLAKVPVSAYGCHSVSSQILEGCFCW